LFKFILNSKSPLCWSFAFIIVVFVIIIIIIVVIIIIIISQVGKRIPPHKLTSEINCLISAMHEETEYSKVALKGEKLKGAGYAPISMYI
jgi:hypothetical protein